VTTDNKLRYYWIILVAVIVSFIIHSIIMGAVASNAIFVTGFICLVIIIPGLVIGFVILLFISRSRFSHFINYRSMSIVAVIISLLIIVPTIFFYFNTVTPEEVTNWWGCDPDQEICNEIEYMAIIYDDTYATKTGQFTFNSSSLVESEFRWEYDSPSKIITIDGRYDSWELKLKLDIVINEGIYDTMTTYYISDRDFLFFNASLFDGATWTAK